MNHELVLEGKAYINHSFQECNIGIDDGKITAIKKILKGDTHKRFSKELLLPAGIDIHVHFRDPGMRHKETFYSGSLAAVFGGISCIFDMPNTIPMCITPEAVIEKQQIANRISIADFGVYAGISNENVKNKHILAKLARLSHGFKIYLGDTTNSFNLSKEHLFDAIQFLKDKNKLVLIHAEDQDCLNTYGKHVLDLVDHDKARPIECELKSIEYVLTLAQSIETPIHICHVSSAQSVKKLKQKPKNISYGITPHHSLLNNSMDHVSSNWLKVNPPLRTKGDQKKLFETVKSGDAFLLESDHAPHSYNEKNKDFSETPSGIPGVETMYPLYLALAVRNQIPFDRVIKLISEHPSQLLNIPKGFISIGYDADIITVNRKNIQKLNDEKLHSKCTCSPYKDFLVLFPESVFIRGQEVVKDKELQVSQGFGKTITQNK